MPLQFLQGPPCNTPDVSKELAITQELLLPDAKPSIEKVLDYCAEVTVAQATLINSVVENAAGQPKRKVIIKGEAEITIKYAAAVLDQQVHAAVFCVPFETLVEWDDGPAPGNPICVYVTTEHFQVEVLDPRMLLGVLVIRLDVFKR